MVDKAKRRTTDLKRNGARRRSEKARTREAIRKAKEREVVRDVEVRKPANRRRRNRCSKDIYKFLRTYFPDTFSGAFTSNRRAMVDAILTAAEYGGDQAIAGPRGDGKTTIVECVALFCLITGRARFALIAAATGPDARRVLDHVKGHLERNDLLAADWPEICDPIRALAGAPQRAGAQTVKGKRTYLKWSQDHIVLPVVDNSPASGAAIATRGLDAAIRGIRIGTMRPDLIIVDDPETRESVMSEIQTERRELIIEEDLAGSGASDDKLARVMLCTLMRRACLSAMYTDPTQKPSWKGRRFKALLSWPARKDLWDEYIALRATDFRDGDATARGAHAFYRKNRKAMDAGAEVGNPDAYNAAVLPDGSRTELSAVQRCYNVIADRGEVHFLTEYNNEPPEETGPIESGITAARIQRQVSGYPRRVVPYGCTVLTQGIDVHKFALYFVVKAWRPDATSFVVDYGVREVHGTIKGSDEAVDTSIVRALGHTREFLMANPYRTADKDEPVEVARTLIDAGYRTRAVYHFCRQAGIEYWPAMGFGKSNGCAQIQFHSPIRATTDKRPGDGWFLSRKAGNVWLVCCDADHWKSWEHDRWMSEPGVAGSASLYGEAGKGNRLSEDQQGHFTIAKHLTAEVEVEEPTRHSGMVRRWRTKSDTNHYFDASYLADVAASMSGISLLARGQAVAVPGTPDPTVAAGGWFASQKRKR